ncbi:MAG: hypothetical protein AB8G18_10715 [Gammaproteobacteria bacterium]
MSADRGAEIERFYWLIVNLLGKVFGYLMLLSGSLFFVAFLMEKMRTGAMTWNGRTLTEFSEQWPLLLGGAVVALIGLFLVRVLPYEKKPLND